ncbi:MAG: LysM peptidoglycan-binding domain-containing protein [Vagococcus fluvialis]
MKFYQLNIIRTICWGTLLFFSFLNGHSVTAEEWQANKPADIRIGEDVSPYTIKLGDTLWAISEKSRANIDELALLNGINLNNGDQYKLQVGQIIYFNNFHLK